MADELQRVIGLVEESEYAVIPAVGAPDFHMKIGDSSISIEGDNLEYEDGSRGLSIVRPGSYIPQPEFEGVPDLKQIGHFLKGVLGNYVYTAGEGTDKNIHEFYGGENRKLPSFTLFGHFDEFIKKVKGTLIQSVSMEVSNEFIKFSVKCVASKDEKSDGVPAATALKTLTGIIPLAFYDVSLLLDGEVPPGIVSTFKWEVSNDIKTDDAVGISRRFMQIKPSAGKRTNEMEMEVSMEPETVKYLEMFEYGAEGLSEPSNCLIAKVPLQIQMAACENPDEKLTIVFPDCIAKAEYSASGSDAMNIKLSLKALKTTNVDLNDAVTEVQTDVYCKLENDIPELVAGGVVMQPEE